MAKRDPNSHGVEKVLIDGAKVRVICLCGWKSKSAKDETLARKQHDTHLRGK